MKFEYSDTRTCVVKHTPIYGLHGNNSYKACLLCFRDFYPNLKWKHLFQEKKKVSFE